MGYNKLRLTGKNDNESINGSHAIIAEIMKAVSDTVSKSQAIIEFKLNLITKEVSEDDIRVFEGDKVFIEKDTMKCIKVSCKDSGSLNNFLTFLEYTYDLHINMTKDVCKSFRTKFSSLYQDAFFGDSIPYVMDVDEINKIFEVRQFKYRLATFKDNGNLIYRLIDVNNENEILTHSYIETEGDGSNSLKTELRNFIIMFKNTYNIMDANTYKIFASGFKNIYNSYVDDKYQKLTITQINNILKSMDMGYEIKRKMQEWFIQKI